MPAGPALFASPVNLDDALRRPEAASRRHFFDQRFDVGAQELKRLMAGLADQVEGPGVAIRVLDPESALAEIALARDACVDHPLEGPIDGGPADSLVFAP